MADANLEIKISANADGARKNLQDAGQAVQGLGQDAQQARSGVEQLGAAQSAAGADARALGAGAQAAGEGVAGAGQAASQAAQQSEGLGKALDDTSKQSAGLDGTLKELSKALTGLFAAREIVGFAKNAIEVADAYGQMAERIRMATSGTEEYELVQKRLLESANITYRQLSEQQELYIQTSAALRSMGYATSQVLDITDSFSYLLATNAASAEKGSNAINAYTKAIQSGKVEVDGWQSIMAATPTIVDAIATATGKTAAEVRSLGVTGQLAVSDLNEGLRQTVEANKAATAGMVTTVNDAMTRLHNTWSAYIGEANRATQSTQKIVALIDTLSNNLDTVVSVAVTAGDVMVAVWGVKALNALKAYTAQLSLAAAETSALMATTTAAGAKMAAGLAAAGKLAAAAWIGWEIGTFLRSEFEVVEKAGIALAAGLHKSAVMAQGAWEMVKATFTDDTMAAATERMNAKLRELDDTYADMFASVGKLGQAKEAAAAATDKAGAAAQNATVQWEGLRTAYVEVNKELASQAAEVEKVAALRNAEAAAAVTMAQALGTEAEQRAAQAKAAATQAEQIANIAMQRQTEVNVLKAERDALMAVGQELLKNDPLKKKQLDDLNHQIALREADAGAAMAQARAAKASAAAAEAEAEAQRDNSARVHELRGAYEQAKAKLEEVRAAKAAGKATTEDLTNAELAAGKAALLYRDALQDQLKSIEARKNLQLADLDVQGAAVRLAIEQQRAIYEVAKARGDEGTAAQAANEIKRLEIELLMLTAQAKRAEAEAAMATLQVKKAELIASGEYNGAKKLEIEAAIKAAEVKRLEGDIAEVTANKLRDLGQAQGELKGRTEDATDSLIKQAGALERLADGVQRVGEGFRNKDGMTSDAKGNVQQQFIWTRSTVIDYLKQAGLEQELAEYLSTQFTDLNGNVGFLASAAQKQWGGKYGTLSEALGKMAQYYKYDDSGKQEAQQLLQQMGGASGNKPPAPSPAPASNNSSAFGGSYVSNITIDGQRTTVNFADRDSQLAAEQLLRQLAQAKGASI